MNILCEEKSTHKFGLNNKCTVIFSLNLNSDVSNIR